MIDKLSLDRRLARDRAAGRWPASSRWSTWASKSAPAHRTYVLTMLTLAVVACLTGRLRRARQDRLRLRRHGGERPDGQLAQVLRHHRHDGHAWSTAGPTRPTATCCAAARCSRWRMFSLLGIFVMISGSNFLVIYLGLELLTLSSYALVALRRDNAVATEAAMKYFVLGALASGFLLYGMSMMYGATGSLDIDTVFKVDRQPARSSTRCWCSAWCSSWPAWPSSWAPRRSTCGCPDVYQGAPTAVTLMIGARAGAGRLRHLHPPAGGRPAAAGHRLAADADGAGRRARCSSATWPPSRRPTSSACWPIRPSRRWASCCWAWWRAWSTATRYNAARRLQRGDVLHRHLRADHAGELRHHPAAGARRLRERGDRRPGRPEPAQPAVRRRDGASAMFSLAGVPPLVGFYAKLAVLQALVASGQALYIALAVFAVMMSLVGAFYYMRVVKVMYFDAPITATTVSAPARRARRADDQWRADPDPGHRAGRPDDAVRQGHRRRRWPPEPSACRRPLRSGWCSCWPCWPPTCLSSTSACWAGAAARGRKNLAVRLAELVLLYFVVGGIGLLLEQRAGQIAPQGWEFYAVTGALFLASPSPASSGATCSSTGH